MVSGKLVLAAIVAFGIAGALGFAGDASAATKKKVTYSRLGNCAEPSLIRRRSPQQPTPALMSGICVAALA